MAGVLDSLLSGAATVGQTALAVPQAVGGGALDILIGDRTNVPAGEQVKRSIEALLLSGDNPANLIAIHQMNAKRDAGNQSIVASPDFQNAMEANRIAKNLSPMEAFDYTAKQYGVKGYAPETTTQPDLSVGPASPTSPQQERQTVPVLPPPSAKASTKYLEDRTKLAAYTQGDLLDQLAARAQGADISLPLDLQKMRADQAMEGRDVPGQTVRTETWNGKEYVVRVQDLPPESRVLTHFGDAIEAANAQNIVLEKFGVTDRVVPIGSTATGWSLTRTTDEELKAFQGAKGSALGTAEGKDTLLGRGGAIDPKAEGRTPRQREADAKLSEAQKEYDAKVAPFLKLVDKMEANLTALPEEGGGVPGAIAGRLQGALGEALPQAFPEQRALTEAGDAAAVMITDLYGGKGAQSDRDIQLMTGQVPRVGVHTRPIGQEKLGELRAAIAARRPGAQAAKGAPSRALPVPENTITTKSGRTITYQE